MKTECSVCKKTFDPDELCDVSGACFDCTDYDPEPRPDLMATTVLAARSAFEKLVKALGRKPDDGQSN